jgi:hypothetical protein
VPAAHREGAVRFDVGASREATLERLRREAEETYGTERLSALQQWLDATSAAIWRLAQAELDALTDLPDTLASGGPRA